MNMAWTPALAISSRWAFSEASVLGSILYEIELVGDAYSIDGRYICSMGSPRRLR